MEPSASGGRRIVGVEAQPDVLGRAKDGDERAFLALFRAAQPGLLRYLAVIVGEAADEIAAQTWKEIGRDLPAFAGSLDDFRAWVAAVGRRRALDHLDALRAVGRLPQQAGPSDEALAAAPAATAAALRAVAALPPEQSEAILLRSVLGLDEGRSAGLLGVRRAGLRRAALRGLRALGRRLESAAGASGASGALGTPAAATPNGAARALRPQTSARALRMVQLPDEVEAHAVGQNTPLPSFDRHRRRPDRTSGRSPGDYVEAASALTPNRGLEVTS